MPETSNQSFNPNFSKELNIESIISAPLVAASKANVFMVTGQTRFLLDYCFTQKEGDSDATREPVMIEMAMQRGVIDHDKKPDEPGYINLVKMTFSVPLLCLVPLNSLVIDKVTVDFDMEITSVTSYDSNHGILDKQAQLHGRICRNSSDSGSGNKNDRQSSSKLKVNINAGPLPLPVGVLAILDLYTKSIQPIPKEDEAAK